LEFTIYSLTRISHDTRLIFMEISPELVEILYCETKQGKETRLNLGRYSKEKLRRLVKAL